MTAPSLLPPSGAGGPLEAVILAPHSRLDSGASDRSLRAKIAAHARWAQSDPDEASRAARRRIEARFLAEADPAGVLSASERARRADHLKKAYFTGLARKSARVRRENK